jgi:hypothetical protein
VLMRSLRVPQIDITTQTDPLSVCTGLDKTA